MENLISISLILGLAVSLTLLWRGSIIGPHAHLEARPSPVMLMDALVALFLALGGPIVCQSLFSYAGWLENPSERTQAILIMMLQLSGFGLASLYALIIHNRWKPECCAWMPISLSGVAVIGCLLTLVLGQGTMVIVANIASYFGHPPQEIAHEDLRKLIDASEPITLVVRLGSAIILAPLFEEIVFRGMLQQGLISATRGRVWWAIILTSLFFAAMHYGPVSWHGIVGILVLGLIWGWLYARSQRLWIPILVHMVFNAYNVLIAFLFFQNTN